MIEFAIPILTFLAVVCIGGAFILARASRQRALQARLAQLGGPYEEDGPRQNRLVELLHGIGRLVSAKGPSPALRTELTKAGYHGFMAAEIYLGIKFLLLVVGLFALTALLLPLPQTLPVKVLLIVLGSAVLSFLPNMFVSLRRRGRAAEVRMALPDAIDLLEICVSAGMGIDMAWNAVADEVRPVSTVLADEMTLANLEIHLGTPRGEAMHHMAERTDADELSSLAGVLAQSEQFGTSVADALRTYASSMREMRSQRAEETAEKMAVKLLLPMIVFIFPTILVVTAGPAIIKLVELFGGN